VPGKLFPIDGLDAGEETRKALRELLEKIRSKEEKK
jgi:hypothetical protein